MGQGNLPTDRFIGTETYVATNDLKLAVNTALTLRRPLLIKGEPGTGKSMLAYEVAAALNMPLLEWHIKSTSKAQQGLYEYDAVSRLRDLQIGDERSGEITNYIVRGVVWQAFISPNPVVLLIDEIDKADTEFPNDLLRELDCMDFFVYETKETIVARHRPFVIITSNDEKELPDAFLRRCLFHYIKFPDREIMEKIVSLHYPLLPDDILRDALAFFYRVRDTAGLKKKPATSELLDWIKLLVAEKIPSESITGKNGAQSASLLPGALIKSEHDLESFKRLASRRSHR